MLNLMLLVACTAPAEELAADAAAAEADRDWEAFLRKVNDQVEEYQVPGIQVGVVIDGALHYSGGAGVVAWGAEEPVTDDTVFRWASVSKMHTATAVLQLVDEGVLDLEAPVTTYLDQASLQEGFDASMLTTHHLLTHTAALPDELTWSCATRTGVLRDHVESSAPPLYAPPGSFYNYSNTGYVWAGALVEELTGAPFIDAMQERVLDPAGMTTATYDATIASAGPHATGTSWWDDEAFTYDLEAYDCAWSRPAAWLHGTATDLARTAEWQLAGGGALLSAANTGAMHAQVDTHLLPDGQFEVGYGQFTSPYKDVTMVWHDGWVTGFTSTWAIVPESNFGVVVVANADWADPYALMYDAVDLFLDQMDEESDEAGWITDPSTWAPYVGTFEDPYVHGTIQVTLEDDRLYARFVDQGERVELLQSAGDRWYFELDGGWTDVRFITDEPGTFSWFVTREGVGTRAEDAALTSGAPPLDEAAWRSLLARYAQRERPEAARVRPEG
ncbi:MAG: serine hydrolase [Pseudomonadota bacterium]|nr:serine hydrolase [Pseudomonadota bacterium]